MQNKPNVKDAQINVNSYMKSKYEKLDTWLSGKNKPNSNPIKPNFKKAKMNVNLTLTKDYRKKDDFSVRINKPNSNPISETPKMNANVFVTKDYENKTAHRPKNTNPNKANFKGKKMTAIDFNSLINFGQIIFMETLKRPPLFIRVIHILSFLTECIICHFKGILRTGKEIRFRFWLQRGQGWQGSKTQAYWLVVRVLLTPPAEAAASQKWKIIYLQVLSDNKAMLVLSSTCHLL